MKIKFNHLLIFTFLCVIFGGVSTAFGQAEQIAGGYINADVNDEAVVAAAKFALRKQSKRQKATLNLVEIKNARMQVVAGMNYEICLQITRKTKLRQKPVEQFVKAVVYRSLKNVYSLTSWQVLKKPDECGN